MGNEETRQTKEDSIDIQKLMTAQDVGEMLGISARTVNKLARNGKLGCVQITGRERRFTIRLLQEFIKAETRHRDWVWDVEF